MSSRVALSVYLVATGVLLWAAWPMIRAARAAQADWLVMLQVILLPATLLVGIASVLVSRMRILRMAFYVLVVLSLVVSIAF